MDLKNLQDTPPWEWPTGTGETFQALLIDCSADPSDRLIAAELAGNMTVINDELADALTAVVRNPGEPEEMRARAAISLGPVLEQTDIDGFDDPLELDDVPIGEDTFRSVQDTFQRLYFDEKTPKEVRRRILEASVRAPESWHQDAIAAAYSSGDKEWTLTAVFAMGWVPGFDDQILEALKSGDEDIHYEAVKAAGERGVAEAWPHVVALINDAEATPRPLLLTAIAAVPSIRAAEARSLLQDLARSDDEEIAAVARDAIGMAEAISDSDEEDDEEVGEWIN